MHGIALGGLALGTQLWLPAGMGFLLMVLLFFRREPFTLRKYLVYGAIVPFALWWLIAPTEQVDRIGPLSIWVLWIPGWYFWFLGWVQLATIGNGGEKRFLWWNSAMSIALGQGVFDWRAWIVTIPWTILLISDFRSFAVAGKNPWRLAWSLHWAIAFGFMLLTWFFQTTLEAQFWKMAYNSSTNRYNRSMMRGFEPTSWLGSFQSEFESPYEREVAVRIYTQNRVSYLRALTYTEYASGVWRSASLDSTKFPVRNLVEYSVFADSQNVPDPTVWVRPLLRDYGYLFLPPGTSIIAALVDSLATDGRGTWRNTSGQRSTGYLVGSAEHETFKPMQVDILVSGRLSLFMDSIGKAWSITPSLKDSVEVAMDRIRSHFWNEFEYTLTLPQLGNEDPLRAFFYHKKGYCEYFATASVLILRQTGIPARYVTGFASPHKQGSAWVFRRSDAHAWVEVWDGESWIIFDPTPPSFRPVHQDWTVWERVREQIQGKLDEWIRLLQFGSWKLLVDRLGVTLQQIFTWRLFAVLFASLFSSLGIFLLWRKKHRAKLHAASNKMPWIRKLENAERLLEAQGFLRSPSETVANWLNRLPSSANSKAIQDLREYQAHRFEKE